MSASGQRPRRLHSNTRSRLRPTPQQRLAQLDRKRLPTALRSFRSGSQPDYPERREVRRLRPLARAPRTYLRSLSRPSKMDDSQPAVVLIFVSEVVAGWLLPLATHPLPTVFL